MKPRYVNLSTTSRICSSMVVVGVVYTYWPIMLAFFKLMVRENSLAFKECCAFCRDERIQQVYPSLKLVFVFLCPFPEGVNGSLVFCIADEVPKCLSAAFGSLLEGLVNDFGELFPEFLLHHS
ncbi:hypothetical protein ElyMa_003466700 [Elysia marginata]|uniref:Uncharacterized protein n=1 Tax=Elysia marginata TaxID=1093978 RepID=A0AAV4EA93_9GAST|nr:hypothetical protein ElyMa_003466700 [Elysia marginata]